MSSLPDPQPLLSPICILGGGPGGSTAALELAKLGIPAILVEKAVFPRDKVCGDALSGKVMRTLERVDLDLAAQVNSHASRMPSWGVVFVAPGGKGLRVPFSRNTGEGEAPGAILPRLQFDDLLFQQMKKSPGITVLEGHSAKTYTRSANGWEVGVAHGSVQKSIHCQLILDASGGNSHFARHVGGLDLQPAHHAAGIRGYFTGVKDLDPQGFIELIFLDELSPGYLWIFPLANGRANVGLGLRSDVVRKRRSDLKATLRRIIAEHPALRDRFADATMEGTLQGMGLPLASKRRKLSGDGYLLIGDAGHLIDPFTGEGISHAMISGRHAAAVAAEMLAAKDLSAKAAEQYDQRVWNRLGQELAISTRLQQLADKPWLFNFVVDRAKRNPALADTISSMFSDLDMRARLKKPGFYVHLLLGR